MSSKSADRRRRDRVAEVVRQIQRGERSEENYEYLFREYAPLLRKLLLRRRWPEPEVDDLVQDILLRVYQGMGSFRFESSFDTWILRIMANAWKNALRKKGAKKPETDWVSVEDAPKSDENPGPDFLVPAGTDNGPLELAMAAERRHRLRAALDKLPHGMRQCLLFRYQGYTIKEIARVHEVTVATVKKQVQKGLRRLRDLLGPMVELFGLAAILILPLS